MTAPHADPVEVMARAIDPLAYEEWTTPPRGLESASTVVLSAEQSRLMRRAKKQAYAAMSALRDAGYEIVRLRAAAHVVRWNDLRPGMICEVKRGGIRRIEAIEPNQYGSEQKWALVRWVRVEDGPYNGRSGRQTAANFASRVTRILSSPTTEG